MITGVVNDDLEVTVKLTLRGPSGQIHKVTAVVDSGFNDCLILPSKVIAQLGLSWQKRVRAILADGSESGINMYAGIVEWDRRKRKINIGEADATPLVGTALLEGYELKAEFRPGGKVTITRLRSP